MVKIGDRVRVKNTMLQNGYTGVLTANTGLHDDPWDYNVELDVFPSGEKPRYGVHLGVYEEQVETIPDDTATVDQYYFTDWHTENDYGYSSQNRNFREARLEYFALCEQKASAVVSLYRVVQWEQKECGLSSWLREKSMILTTAEEEVWD